MPAPIHFTTPALLKTGKSACGLDHAIHQVSANRDSVTCSECHKSLSFLTRPAITAGRAAVPPAHYGGEARGAWHTACGIKQGDHVPTEGIMLMPEWSMVSCDDCWRVREETAGRPAVVMHHLPRGGFASACGINLRSDEAKTHAGAAFDNRWGVVNCPDCLNIHSRESEIPMPENRTLETQHETQERITAEHRHDWGMVDGPSHVHDCEECIYLGTKYFVATYDLYWCSQGTRPTVIARRGPDGDYESGLDFVDRTPIMALAYVRALQAGLVTL